MNLRVFSWDVLRWLLLTVTLFIIYEPARRGEFLWDDVDIYIVNNALLRAPDGLYRFWFTSQPVDYYPLTYSSFWFEWRIAGLDPAFYRTTNILLHLACTGVLACLLRQLGVPGAGVVATLFAVHPLQLESIAWICQRKSVLAALFGYAAASAYVADHRNSHAARYALSVGLFALSLAAKPTLIMFPFLVILFDAAHVGRITRRSIARATPFFLVAAVFGGIGWAYQRALMAGVDMRGQDLAARLASIGWAAWFYVGQAFRLWDLCFVYPRWVVDGWSPSAWIPNACVVGLLGTTFTMRRTWGPLPWAAWAAFLLTMLPALGITDVFYWRYSFVADHYVYQSLPAILAMIVWASLQLTSRTKLGIHAARLAGFAAALACSLATFDRAFMYRTQHDVWTTTIAKNPRAALAWANLATLSLAEGDISRARALIVQALEIDPSLHESWNTLGGLYRFRREWGSARDAYEHAVRLAPEGSAYELFARFGRAISGWHTLDQTIAHQAILEIADELRRTGDDSVAGARAAGLLAQCLCYLTTESPGGSDAARERARQDLSELLAVRPDVTFVTAKTLDEVRRPDLAFPLWQRCCAEFPKEPSVLLAAGMAAGDDVHAALRLLREAARLDPGNPDIQKHLTRCLLRAGLDEEARPHFEAAIDGYHRRVQARDADPDSLRELAWLSLPLAESKPEIFMEVVSLAEKACVVTDSRSGPALDLLAAVEAAGGNFTRASELCVRAIDRTAAEGGAPQTLAEMEGRLGLYRQNLPYRDPLLSRIISAVRSPTD